ncbi:hypothetical protein Y032_0542g3216 [Ancylostoma ceylanicum]|nr:hypothetical protein Y032_0542g3216 [Ancylostoma ceylanicum]
MHAACSGRTAIRILFKMDLTPSWETTCAQSNQMFTLGCIFPIFYLVLIADVSALGCPPLSEPEDGYIKYGHQSSQGNDYENGTVATLMCDRNRLDGPMHTTCTNGRWDPPQLADCEKKRKKEKSCKDIRHGTESNIIYSATENGRHPHMSTASKTCVNGAPVLGLSFANCVRGRWVPRPFGRCPTNI